VVAKEANTLEQKQDAFEKNIADLLLRLRAINKKWTQLNIQ
jgi:hypothetical protein